MSRPAFGFDLLASDGAARRGRLTTAHGTVETPAFMPVGTQGTVKGMSSDSVAATGAEMILANTYHLMLRPGAERVARLGGLHRFMDWPGPILTDSGGFQVMSLADLREIAEAGVTFRSHLDGSRHELTPERAVELQARLGSDVTMVLDECTKWPVSEAEAAQSMRLSMRWAGRAKAAFEARPGHGLFGIVQGSVYPALRAESAEALAAVGFDGYAIGGLAVGEARERTFEILDATTPRLPAAAPRYPMGVGRPEDMVAAVAMGVDLFDCVLPTRGGRMGRAYTRRAVLNLRNARHADDPRPLDQRCACPACARLSRAYLHHLVRADEMLGPMLLTGHNLAYYQDLMAEMRGAIEAGELAAFRAAFEAEQAKGDIEETQP